jgi:hypothetical protein
MCLRCMELSKPDLLTHPPAQSISHIAGDCFCFCVMQTYAWILRTCQAEEASFVGMAFSLALMVALASSVVCRFLSLFVSWQGTCEFSVHMPSL